jgi:hypothetical protein
MTRKGAPFHGAIGEDKIAISAASSQAPNGAWACEFVADKTKIKNAPAISDSHGRAATHRRAKSN